VSKQRAVRIRNAAGGCGFTSAKRALKYVQRGQARLVGDNEIEFIASDFRAISAEASMKSTTEPDGASPSHGPVLLVGPTYNTAESTRTFAPYPYRWQGYLKAA
jgi:hypothetical protein